MGATDCFSSVVRVNSAYPATAIPTTTCGTHAFASRCEKPNSHGEAKRNNPVKTSNTICTRIGTNLNGLSGLVVVNSLSRIKIPTYIGTVTAAPPCSAKPKSQGATIKATPTSNPIMVCVRVDNGFTCHLLSVSYIANIPTIQGSSVRYITMYPLT